MSNTLPPAEPGATRWDRGEPITFQRAITVRLHKSVTAGRDLLQCGRCGALVHPDEGRTQHAAWHYGQDRVLALIHDSMPGWQS